MGEVFVSQWLGVRLIQDAHLQMIEFVRNSYLGIQPADEDQLQGRQVPEATSSGSRHQILESRLGLRQFTIHHKKNSR